MTERSGQRPPADDELWALAEAFVDGTAAADERDRLEARLRSEPAARQFYVAYLDLHAQLQWRTRGQSAPPAAAPPARRRSGPVIPRPYLAAAGCLAAALLAAVLLHRPGPTDDGEAAPDLPAPPGGSVAVLIDNKSAVWDEGMALPTEAGSALPPGRLKLRAGVVEVAFRGGGDVLLEGPADFDVSASDHGFLHRGKLTAMVAAGAPAFRVGMPGVVVTDVGGVCGLVRDDTGRTEVHVFEGEVGADPTDGRAAPLPWMRLLTNAGARIDALRRTVTPVPLDERAFARLRPEVRMIDASIRGGAYAGQNFGTASRLMVKNSIPDYSWEAYLRFDLAGVNGHVGEARVRLVPVRVGQPVENAVAVAADNQWGETTVTWDAKPPAGPAFATWVAEQGRPAEFDVTGPVRAALAGDKKLLSLRVFASKRKRGSAYVQYGSREGEVESRPQLLITTVPETCATGPTRSSS
jgi:ferric-dicitrate binding protein FerR (iron transport regulator)